MKSKGILKETFSITLQFTKNASGQAMNVDLATFLHEYRTDLTLKVSAACSCVLPRSKQNHPNPGY